MEIIKDVISKSKNDKLDPLSVIVKLFIYSYKPVGTKLSIHNNKIHIQDAGLFQGTVRTLYGDSKNDINIIFSPILFACKYYLIESDNVKYHVLFKKLLDGFDKLKETYQTNEITYSIDQLKNIVNSFLSNRQETEVNNLLNTYNTTNPINQIKQDIYKHISTIWTEKRLNILFGYIDEITELSKTNSQSDLINYLIDSLSTYMNCIDLMVCGIISSIN
jgi:hypothetical protein